MKENRMLWLHNIKAVYNFMQISFYADITKYSSILWILMIF